MKMGSRRLKTYLAAGTVVLMGLIQPFTAMAAEPWSMENGQYVDASGAPVTGALFKGITVSKYQNRASESAGGIDWTAVKADGVEFAMIRLGYHHDMDPYYAMNMVGAASQGLKVGAFFYTQALDVQTAVEEAQYVLELVKDYPLSYPIAYDVESQYLLDQGLSRQQLTDQINAFCKVIADAGYRPIVYLNNNWLTNHVDSAQIPYDIWYARYGTSVNNCQNRTIWQCDQEGTVDGIVGDVTVELAFVDYSTLIPADGWKCINGRWYYMKNHVKHIGWAQVGDYWYYLDSNGIMVQNTELVIDGVSYRFNSDGVMLEQ